MRLLASFTLALVAMSSAARANDFLFSIAPTSGSSITGEITGLASSGTSTPTGIYIFSQPSGYTYPAIPSQNLLTSGYSFYLTDNNFTVTSGAITGANVGIYKPIGGGGDIQGYGFDVTYGSYTGANGIYQAIGTTVTSNTNTSGLLGATYTPVPEPRQTALIFLAGIFALWTVRKLRVRWSS